MKLTIEALVGLSPAHAAFVIEYCKDWSARRAAEASGFSPDSGYELRDRPEIQAAIQRVVEGRLHAADVDAEWVLLEAVDNHKIARQRGNITASNTALSLIAKNVMVDAFAAQRVDMDVNTSDAIIERLKRGRARANAKDDPVSFL